MSKDEGETKPVEDEATAHECPMDGTITGRHHWVWTDGIHKSFKQHCVRCDEKRVVDPKKAIT